MVGRLKAYEEIIKGEDKVTENQNKLLYSKAKLSNKNIESSRGRGWGQIIEVEDVVLDMVRVIHKLTVTQNPLKIMKIKSKRENNMIKEISQASTVTSVKNMDTSLQDAQIEQKTMRQTLVRHTKERQIVKK